MTLWINTNGTNLNESEIKAGVAAAEDLLALAHVSPYEAEDAYRRKLDGKLHDEACARYWEEAESLAILAATKTWAETPEDLSLVIG